MNKFHNTFASVVLMLILSFVCIACGSSKDNSKKTIEDLLEHFSKTFEVSDEDEIYYDMIGAIDGCRVDLDDETIVVLKFDVSDAGGKSLLKDIQSKNILKMGVLTFPAAVNGSFAVGYPSDFSEKDKLLKSFNSF